MERFKNRASIVLISGLLILCVGFVVIGCGNAVLKVLDPDKGLYAIDFTDCPVQPCKVILGSSEFTNPVTQSQKSIADKELTVEAWIKNLASPVTNFTGAIFGRFSDAGIMLYAKDGVIKAAIRRVVASGGSTATTDYIISSGTLIADALWHHVAAVLVNQDHNDGGVDDHLSVTCADGTGASPGGESETPHMDIYVDGIIRACATTWGNTGPPADPATGPSFTQNPAASNPTNNENVTAGIIAEAFGTNPKLEGIDETTPLPGAVDEVRLWGIARSASDINACMGTELTIDAGVCNYPTNLISYMRFNEGQGASVGDRTGLGSGIKLYFPAINWTTGWTLDAAPITKQR